MTIFSKLNFMNKCNSLTVNYVLKWMQIIKFPKRRLGGVYFKTEKTVKLITEQIASLANPTAIRTK